MSRFLAGFCFLSPLFVGNAMLLNAAQPPNIVVILADDLGYADVGYHGSDIKTPNIDRIASEGVKLERFYSCPMCSPTRAGFLTGRWPLRFGMMRAVVPPWCSYGLPNSETTLPELLASAGYNRRGIVGKWHLGHSKPQHHPLAHGFTHFYGHYNGAIDYFTHEREGEVDWHRNRETVKEAGYSTDLLASEAERFIDETPKEEPYFLYVPFNAPHSPFQAKDEDLAKYPKRKGKQKTLAAMIDCLDQGIGKILEAIDQRGDADNTFVLFFSDNGGVRNVADNTPWRGAKLTPYEGGIRVVACARFPNGGLTGGKVVNETLGYIDLLPTICGLAGVSIPGDLVLDGTNVISVMQGKESSAERNWFTYEAQNSHQEKSYALSQGDWKLVLRGPGIVSFNPDEIKIELFNLKDDPTESRDVARENHKLTAELILKLNEFSLLGIDGVPIYSTGREGFQAPADWRIE